MTITRNLKLLVLFLLMICSFNSHATFTAQPDTIETGNFLLLTPLKKKFADRVGLRTNEHLIINENERVKYTLKGSNKTKRGRVIRIMDDEVQFYNQVTGKLDYVPIDEITSISRTKNWKAMAGYFLLYNGISAFTLSLIATIFIIILVISGSLSNNGGIFSSEDLAIAGFYGIATLLVGIACTYGALNILYKYKKFRIGKDFKIDVYLKK